MDWALRPWWVMGIVNLTPDSFSDGGMAYQRDAALRHCEQLIADGAHILDLGAESTRPGAIAVSVQEELDRLLPVLEAVRQLGDIPISIDTYKPDVMEAALALGAKIINDVQALQQPDAVDVLARSKANVCLMHMQGTVETMQASPSYQNVTAEVIAFLQARVNVCVQNGISIDRIVLDPGFGFGKSQVHNETLFRDLRQLVSMGLPVLVGVSRKRMIGEITSRSEPVQRRAGSVAAAVEAVRLGAKIVRVHDVADTVDALKVASALGVFGSK
jgi:dihydropteroate synthase